MLSQDQKFEHIQLLAKQAVEGFIIGLHKSPFHGFSVEFAEHRLYNQGDNLKHIDWKVFGKSDKLFIKRYEEETNLRCNVVIDTSSSMHFPQEPKHYSKLQFSAIAAASILHILKGQQDAGGISLFDKQINYSSPIKSNGVHYNNLNIELEKLLNYNKQNTGTQTAKVLHDIAERTHRRSLVIIFSDMLDRASELEEIFDALQHLKYNKHEVILFNVVDKAKEIDFDFDNRPYEFIDLETGDSIKLNSLAAKEKYVQKIKYYKDSIALRCAQFNIDIVDADINLGFNQILLPYFMKRNKMV
jgi:uncharacterized protein (DUF58 family)